MTTPQDLPTAPSAADNTPETVQERRSTERGFTLVEILVAIAILGILGAVAVREVFQYIDEAKQTATKAKVDNVHNIVADFKRKHGRLPDSLDELTIPDERRNGEAWISEDGIYDAWNYPMEIVMGERTSQFEIVSRGEGNSEDGFDWEYGLEMDISSKVPLGGSISEQN